MQLTGDCPPVPSDPGFDGAVSVLEHRRTSGGPASKPVVRPLLAGDLDAVRALIDADPVANAFLDTRIHSADPWRIGGDVLVYESDGQVRSAVYSGSNLVPLATDPASRLAFAQRLGSSPRRSSSIVGPREEVLDLWRWLEPHWKRARAVRDRQPLMAIDHDPLILPDPRVRLVDVDELDTVLPACIDMFTEEIGISPLAGGGGAGYRARVLDIVRARHAFAIIDADGVVFKAEVGIAADRVCQVQGVWVRPSLRGRGIAAPAMAAVVAAARAQIAPVVSLYVNDFNTAARKAYRRVGFAEIGSFATVLF